MTVKLPQNLTLPNKGPKGNGGKGGKGDGKKGDGKGLAGNGKGGKNKGKKGMPKMFGARAGYEGVPTRRVNRLVGGVIRDEVRDLRGQLRGVRADSREAVRNVRRDARRGKQDLRYVHGETADVLGNISRQNTNMYAQQADSTAAANAALQQMLGGTYSGAQAGAESELARLGLGGQQSGTFDQMMLDAANAQGVAQQSGANAMGTMGMAGTNSAAGMAMLQGMNQGSYMQGIGQNLNARNDALSEIRTNRIDNVNEVRRAIRDAKSSRRDLFFQLLQQLQQTGWDQYMQQQQLQLQRKALRKS